MKFSSMIESATPMATPVGDKYVLQTGESGHERLILLHNVYGRSTERLLRNIGVFPDMHCADIGCGVGTVSCWLARHAATVTALDASSDQLKLVAKHASDLGLPNVKTHEANAYETGLPDNAFDLVYCRFLLCHMQRPMDALREFVRITKPGGAVACEDIDVLDTFAEPDNENAYARFRGAIAEMSRRKGVNCQFGRKLYGAFRARGFASVEVAVDQPLYSDGQEKRLWEYTFAEAIPGLVECGAINEESGAEILDSMRRTNADPEVLVGVASKWQVWGRKGDV